MWMLVPSAAFAIAFPATDASWTVLSSGEPKVECTEVAGEPWCRSTAVFAAAPADVAETLRNLPAYQHLFDSVERIDVVEPDTLHVVLDFPSPVDDRDYVAKYTELEEGGARLFRWASVVHPGAPELAGVVRLPDMAGEWQLVAEGAGTRVTYLWTADVRGSFPSFLLNKARVTAGTRALDDLREATAARGEGAPGVARDG